MTGANGTRRVVITGLGIISCIGLDQDAVLQSLQAGRSGIGPAPEYAELGFRSQVAGRPDIDLEAAVPSSPVSGARVRVPSRERP